MPEDGEPEDAPVDRRIPPPAAAGQPSRHDPTLPPTADRTASDAAPSPPRDGGLQAAVEEMEAVADRYREDGWETFLCHPGGVDTLDGEQGDSIAGIDVVIADNELDEAVAFLEAGAFDRYRVYRDAVMGIILFVVAVEDRDDEAVLLFTGYLDLDDFQRLVRPDADDAIRLYLRTVTGEHVEFGPVAAEYFLPESEPSDGNTTRNEDSSDG